MKGTCFLLLLAVFATVAGPMAHAHELSPAIVNATIVGNDTLTINITTNAEALIAGIDAQHNDTSEAPNVSEYDQLRLLPPEDLRGRFEAFDQSFLESIELTADEMPLRLTLRGVEIPPVGNTATARLSELQFGAELPGGTENLTWRYAKKFGDSVFRLRLSPDGEIVQAVFVPAGQASAPIAVSSSDPGGSAWQLFSTYIFAGFDHIVPKGLDHVLFVLGLFLLTPRFRPLAWQVTGFTVAHSVTLALGIFGLVNLPANIVEPLIAASIVFIAVENLFTDRLHRWRPAVVFGFGLLHGLGFVSVLTEFGLPREDFAIALVAFNLGIEAAQLMIVTLCFVIIGLGIGHRKWYRPMFAIPASLVIAAVAIYWLLDRTGIVA